MPKGIISMGRAQFQTRQDSTSPMSPFGCDVIVARSLPRRRPRIRRHLGKHFTLRFGECWTLRPNPARCFGTRPRGFTSISKPEVVHTSAAAAACSGVQSWHACATQPTPRAFPSTRRIEAGAPSGHPGSAIRRRSAVRLRPADRNPAQADQAPIHSCAIPTAQSPAPRALTAAHNNACLVCAAIVGSCPARNP